MARRLPGLAVWTAGYLSVICGIAAFFGAVSHGAKFVAIGVGLFALGGMLCTVGQRMERRAELDAFSAVLGPSSDKVEPIESRDA